MRNPFHPLAVVAALACLGCTGGARADFIVNGGFETGDFTGWTLSGNISDPTTFGVDMSNPHSGLDNAYFGPQGSQAFLMQAVTTIPGFEYELDFYLMNEDGNSPNEFTVQFGTATPLLVDQVNLPTFAYTEYKFFVVAAAAVTDLTFGFRNDFAFFNIDDISLRGVPEPGSLACLAIGAVLLGCQGWRKRLARPPV